MAATLSILMLAGIALLIGSYALWRRGGPAIQVFLMILLATIMFANVAIWIVPDDKGSAPVSATPR